MRLNEELVNLIDSDKTKQSFLERLDKYRMLLTGEEMDMFEEREDLRRCEYKREQDYYRECRRLRSSDKENSG